MRPVRIFMHTRGIGSGHLSRINSVYKGFVRAGISCEFFASTYSPMYRDILEPGVQLYSRGSFPERIHIFICDWKTDQIINELPKSMAKLWVGLRRLGKVKAGFPAHYHVVAIEPEVEGDVCIWPIINTWPDELLSRRALEQLLGFTAREKIGLLCENGAYLKHIDGIFRQQLPPGVQALKCSNSRFAASTRDLNYYPVARLFSAVDFLVISGGYNSVHEALSYANLNHTKVIPVGGDDQALRIGKMGDWEARRGSQAHRLSAYLINLLDA